MAASEESREDQLVDLIVFAISQELRRDYRKAISDTRIAKIVYDVADELNLPITRSWYKFGTYVWWSDYAKENRLKQYLGVLEAPPDLQLTIGAANRREKSLYDKILDIVGRHRLMLHQDLNEFLVHLYKKEAPPGFGPVYLGNKKLIDKLDRILDSVWSGDTVPRFKDISKDITDFHKSLFYFEDQPDLIDLVIDGTSLLEDLLVTYETNLSDSARLKELAKFFKPIYEFYKDKVWAFPASVFTIRSAIGERSDAVKEDRSRYLSEIPQYRDEVSSMSDRALALGFYPSRAEIDLIQSQLAKSIAGDEKTLRRLYADHLLVER